MAELPLTQGQVAQIDDAALDWVHRYRWQARLVRGKWYAVTQFHTSNGRRTTRYLHRMVFGEVDRKVEIDHINGDSLDDRRENLRATTHSENQQNRAYGYGEVPVRGVGTTPSGKYVAQAKVAGKHYTFGRFDTIEEAEQAAIEGRLKVMTHSDPKVREIRAQQQQEVA